MKTITTILCLATLLTSPAQAGYVTVKAVIDNGSTSHHSGGTWYLNGVPSGTSNTNTLTLVNNSYNTVCLDNDCMEVWGGEAGESLGTETFLAY